MRAHALIANLLALSNKHILRRWLAFILQVQGPTDLHLCAKGFFIVIFFPIQRRAEMFEAGPDFLNSVGLRKHYWIEQFDPVNEVLVKASILIYLYFLPNLSF